MDEHVVMTIFANLKIGEHFYVIWDDLWHIKKNNKQLKPDEIVYAKLQSCEEYK